MNVVIQFVVYPYLNSAIGAEAFGVLLYLMSIVAILANSFGMALNNTRLVIRTKFESSNGDYNTLMLIFFGVSCVVALIILYTLNLLSLLNGFLFCILIVVTLLRYYSDVEYRLNLNYFRYFIYYLLISAGYLCGIWLYRLTNNWYSVLILGESVAVLFVFASGKIYRKSVVCSENRKTVWKMTMMVAISYLIANFFLNMDRLVLQNLLGGEAVTTFYAASVLGKTVALLIGPINGVMIAYLSKFKGNFSKKLFTKAVLLALVLSIACFVGCVLVSPWLIKLLYPNVYDSAYPLIGVATLGQIVFFTSSLLLAVILRFCHEKHQLTIQVIYGILYIILSIPMTLYYGIEGFAYATLIVGIIRFIIVTIVGYKEAKNRRAAS
jgi:O-antigen/teichoic acid export membrane protein